MRRVAAGVAGALLGVAGLAAPAVAHDETPDWLGDVPGLGAVAPDPTDPDAPVQLDGCTIANPLFAADPALTRAALPGGYRLAINPYLGPGRATVIAAAMRCDRASVLDDRPTPTTLTTYAVQVVAEPTGADLPGMLWDAYNRSSFNFLPSSSWYLLAARTDNGALAGVLAEAGLPADHVPGLTYRADHGGTVKRDLVTADGYELRVSTLVGDPFVHNHDWTFWHGAPGRRSGFQLHLHAMSDSSCGYTVSPLVGSVLPCGATLSTPPGSRVARLIGTRAHTPFAFNHPPSRQPGYVTLFAQEKT